MSDTIKYLRSREWSMGNGQCPECYGPKPHDGWWTSTIGHKRDCPLALSLLELKAGVDWECKNIEDSYLQRRELWRTDWPKFNIEIVKKGKKGQKTSK